MKNIKIMAVLIVMTLALAACARWDPPNYVENDAERNASASRFV